MVYHFDHQKEKAMKQQREHELQIQLTATRELLDKYSANLVLGPAGTKIEMNKASDPFKYHLYLGFLILEFKDGCSVWTCFPCNRGKLLLPDMKVSRWRKGHSVETCKLFIELECHPGPGTYHPPLASFARLSLAEATELYAKYNYRRPPRFRAAR